MDLQAIWNNFWDTVSNHYFDMHGRVGRGQFWYFVLVCFAVSILASILQGIVWLPLAPLFNLAILLPWMGMGARRLQDTGRDGRLVWLSAILFALTQIIGAMTAMSVMTFGVLGAVPFAPGLGLVGLANLVVGVILIWFWIQPGNAEPNAYGPVPPRFDPAPVKPAI